MTKTIYLDCDGILGDFVKQLLREVKAVYDVDIDYEAITTFDIAQTPGFTPDMWSLCYEQEFVASMSLLPGAVEAVEELRKLADVHILTAPFDNAPYWMDERTRWLKKHFGFDKTHIHHSHRKDLFRGDFLLDDRAEHVESWVWNDGAAVLWDRPWNRAAKHLPRISSWPEVIEIVSGL